MSDLSEFFTSNISLNAMAPNDLELLRPHLHRENLAREQVLLPANLPIEHVWSLEGGVASVVCGCHR
jgi:hypothetical protein